MTLGDVSEKFRELLYGQAGLTDNRAKRAGLKVAVAMQWHRNCSCLVIRMHEKVMTSRNPIDDEPRFA